MFSKITSKIAMTALVGVFAFTPASYAGESGGGEGGNRGQIALNKKVGKTKTRPRKPAPKVTQKEVKDFTARIKRPSGRTWFKLRYKKGRKKGQPNQKGRLTQYAKSRRNGKWVAYRSSEITIDEIKKGASYDKKTRTTTIRVKDMGGKTRTFTIRGKLQR